MVAEDITILPLPPKSPELNPVENLRLFMRENWLSSEIFEAYDDIIAHCCDTWPKLESQPLARHVHRSQSLDKCVPICATALLEWWFMICREGPMAFGENCHELPVACFCIPATSCPRAASTC